MTGQFARRLDGDNPYAWFDGGTLTSAAFTVESDAQFGSVMLRGMTASSDQVYVHVLAGTGYATATLVYSGGLADAWTRYPFNLEDWLGQNVKL